MEMKGNGGPAGATASAEDVLDTLNDLLQLNHDAIGAYDIAIEKLEDRDHASQISGFKLDHERHIRELNDAILGLGGSPRNEPHKTSALKEAMQNLGAMAGDRGALLAWRANELQVRTKYDKYASKAVHWSNDVKRLIDQQALDEERHYRWVAETLAALGTLGASGVGSVRNRIAGVADTAREKAASGVSTARERASEGLDRAAGLGDEVENRVRTSPLKTLLMLFGVGFIIGRILR
jgi:bacterioferritin (cytochrome b1)